MSAAEERNRRSADARWSIPRASTRGIAKSKTTFLNMIAQSSARHRVSDSEIVGEKSVAIAAQQGA